MNSAWTWDEKTQEYYLSLFTPEQPDLNWENPAVRAAVHDVLRFWLDRGASGFRMDVINMISKVQDYPDAEVVVTDHEYQPGFKYFANGPRLHEFLKEMNREVLSKYDTITVGEMPFVRDEDEILRIVKAEEKELNMIFIFELVDVDNVPGSYRMTLHPWEVKVIKHAMNRWQRLMIDRDGWNSLFCENHDNPVISIPDRIWVGHLSDALPEIHQPLCRRQRRIPRHQRQAPLHDANDAGRHAVRLPRRRARDAQRAAQLGPRRVQGYRVGQLLEEVNPSTHTSPSTSCPRPILHTDHRHRMNQMYPDNEDNKLDHARHILQRKARDNSRTPVQWDASPNAGFCPAGVKPWMRVNDDYPAVNAAAEQAQSDPSKLSVLQFWKRALEHRKRHKAVFVYGDFELVDPEHGKIFAYRRWSDEDAWLVVLNLSGESIEWQIPGDVKVSGWMAGNYTVGKPAKEVGGKITLSPWEGLLGQCKS